MGLGVKVLISRLNWPQVWSQRGMARPSDASMGWTRRIAMFIMQKDYQDTGGEESLKLLDSAKIDLQNRQPFQMKQHRNF